MKRQGFTLVEMLVVIGILAILITTLLGVFSGATESARAAKCLSNMRSLAVAASGMTWDGAGEASNNLAAGSKNYAQVYMNNGKLRIEEQPGWISWDAEGTFPADHKITEAEGLAMSPSTYAQFEGEQGAEKRNYLFKHGTLYKRVGGNLEVFRCPTHVHKMPRTPPMWSYVMNANIGVGWVGKRSKDVKDCNPERVLLLAEIPFLGTEGGDVEPSSDNGAKYDCVLQHKGCEGHREYIGFNHRTSKKLVSAHVVFVDCHTEKLVWPSKNGMSEQELAELTEWLCNGESFSFDGSKYKELKLEE